MSSKKENSLLNILFPYKFNINNIIITFLIIILIRLIFEWHARTPSTMPTFFYEWTHTTFFFYIFFIVCVLLLIKIAKFKPPISISLTLIAFIFVIFPPIIDWTISNIFFKGTPFLSYYLFDSPYGLFESFLTFFGDKPRDGITYGSRIMVAMAIIFFSILTYINTKSILRTLSIAVSTYIISFFLSSLPSLLTFVLSSKHFSAINFDVAALIASPTTILNNQIPTLLISINTKMTLVYLIMSILLTLTILFKQYTKTFIELLKNIRPIQTIYHLGLLFIGIGLAIMFTEAFIMPSFFTFIAFILLCTAIIFAWYSTVIFNDCVDQKIDKISNPTRPLIIKIITVQDYKRIGIILAIMSIIIVMSINHFAALALMAYHALSYIYNMPPLRLKRFPILATFVAAIASFLIVLIGFIIISPNHSASDFPSHIAILLIITYTISLPIKDLKDIKGDKANNIYTIPVIFGEKIGRNIIATSIFISFMLSVFMLGTNSILFPAILSGALSFWTLVGQKNTKFLFKPKQAMGIVFIIASLYTFILALALFN